MIDEAELRRLSRRGDAALAYVRAAMFPPVMPLRLKLSAWALAAAITYLEIAVFVFLCSVGA